MVPASLRCRATSRPEPRSRPPCGGPRRLLASCCLPSAACYLSPAACCLPPSVYCLTPVARCLPSAARCLPSAATAKCQTRPPPADHCLPPVVCHHGRPPSAAPPERRTSPPATTRTLPPIRLIDATIGIAPAPLSDMPPTIPLAIPCGLTPATTHKPKPQNFNDLSSDFEIHSGELHAKLLPARPRQQPNRYKTLPTRPHQQPNRYKTLPTHPHQQPNRYKTLPTRPKLPISACFARARRTLYRRHHHDPQQGELCTAPSAKPGTKLSQHTHTSSPTGTKLSQHTQKGPFQPVLHEQGELCTARTTKKPSRENFVPRPVPNPVQNSPSAPFYSGSAKKFAQHTQKRRFSPLSRLQGEFFRAQASNKPRRANYFAHGG